MIGDCQPLAKGQIKIGDWKIGNVSPSLPKADAGVMLLQ
jgi:hypothetical protein